MLLAHRTSDAFFHHCHPTFDGDHLPNDHTNIREGGADSKEAEEVQGMDRNKLKQSNSALGTSPEN